MIRVQIGGDEKELATADEHWINQQINRRRAEDQTVCVRVTVEEGNLSMILSTPTCGGGSGGRGRPPSPYEKEIFSLWNQRGLDDVNFTGGNLVAFLKQLRNLL